MESKESRVSRTNAAAGVVRSACTRTSMVQLLPKKLLKFGCDSNVVSAASMVHHILVDTMAGYQADSPMERISMFQPVP